MVRLAVADDANYAVDDAEINRKGLSYTVDTVAAFGGAVQGCAAFSFDGTAHESAPDFAMGSQQRVPVPSKERLRTLEPLRQMLHRVNRVR